MNLYFANRSFDILGMASTLINSKWPITNDVHKEDIDSGMTTLEFDFHYQHATDRPKAKHMAQEGNYILYKGVMGETFFTIIEMESNPVEKTIHIYAEDAGLDLLNEIAPAFAAPSSPKPITYYTDRFLSDDITVGINQVSSRTRTLSWDSDSTVTERLQSLASQFDCEIKFRFQITELMVVKKYLDIYDRRGKDVAQELRLGREIENLIEKRSVANLATAIRPTGAAPEKDGEAGKPITLSGYHYDDGDFYVDGDTVKSRTALKTWGRYNAKRGYNYDHTVKTFSYNTTSQVVLCNQTIARLKKLREPEVTYEVSLLYLPKNLKLGDTIRIVDDKGEVYLSARLLKMEVSETNDYRSAEFGEFIVKTSGLSDRLLEIAAKIREEAAKAVKYEWIVYADDSEGHNMSLDSTGKRYIGIAANKITPDPDLDHPLLYKWSKIEGVDGQDGEDGFSPTATITKEGTEATITITDINGTTTEIVSDGLDGEDGFSPMAVVTKSGNIATIMITDINGTTTETVSDGEDGKDAVNVYILSSGGTTFKRHDISTTLTAYVYEAGIELTAAQLAEKNWRIVWYKNGESTSVGTGLTLQVVSGRGENTYEAVLEEVTP